MLSEDFPQQFLHLWRDALGRPSLLVPVYQCRGVAAVGLIPASPLHDRRRARWLLDPQIQRVLFDHAADLFALASPDSMTSQCLYEAKPVFHTFADLFRQACDIDNILDVMQPWVDCSAVRPHDGGDSAQDILDDLVSAVYDRTFGLHIFKLQFLSVVQFTHQLKDLTATANLQTSDQSELHPILLC